MTTQLQEILLLLSTGHLFGLYNPNQLADTLAIPKATLYRHLKDFSIYQWKCLLIRIGCAVALAEIQDTETKSASTQSRRVTMSVDDTNDPRYGKLLSYCYKWWSKKHNNAIRGRNVLGITIKIGLMIIPLNIRIVSKQGRGNIVSKQGRGNTDKLSCLLVMFKEILDFFDTSDVDLRKYPITFDSWYGSQNLVESLFDMGFENILIHGKNNYLMAIDNKTAKLSEHKNRYNCALPNGDVLNLIIAHTRQVGHSAHLCYSSFSIWVKSEQCWCLENPCVLVKYSEYGLNITA